MINVCLVIMEQALLHLPLMFGAYVSFSLLKVPDLSIEAAYTVGALAALQILSMNVCIPVLMILLLVLGASLLAGACVGLIAALLTRKGKFSHLLSSIVTVGLFHGINQAICPQYVSLTKFTNPIQFFNYVPRHPELIVLFLIGLCIMVLFYALFKTQLGYSYAVYGNNPQFFKNYGISTSFVFITGIMIAHACAGLSGYLFAQSNNFIELNMGVGKALLCVTALILGKVCMPSRKLFSVFMPIFGTGIYFTVQQMLLKVGFNLKYFTAIQAVLVLCIVLYTYQQDAHVTAHDSLGV